MSVAGGVGKADLDLHSPSLIGKSQYSPPQLSTQNSTCICPDCKSSKVWRDGYRYSSDNLPIQRLICQKCGRRFSEPSKQLNTSKNNALDNHLSVEKAKKMVMPQRKHCGMGVLTEETKALIDNVFASWLKGEGYSGNRYPENIKTLVYLGADLNNPNDVKIKLGNHTNKDGAKMQYAYAYTAFLKMQGKTWDAPTYHQEEANPFIPDESELDQLIAGSHSRRLGTYLQTLKETMADPGEGLRIEWIDISGRIININHPVKGHLPRPVEVSEKLISMIDSLPRKDKRVFPMTYRSVINSYVKMKKRIAEATKNDRLLSIELRTFRHWAATMTAYYSNGNVLLVQRLLGHKRIENTMKYIRLMPFKVENHFETVTASTPEEVMKLGQSGWQKYDEMTFNGVQIHFYRKPKSFSSSTTENMSIKRENEASKLLIPSSRAISRANDSSPSFSLFWRCVLEPNLQEASKH